MIQQLNLLRYAQSTHVQTRRLTESVACTTAGGAVSATASSEALCDEARVLNSYTYGRALAGSCTRVHGFVDRNIVVRVPLKRYVLTGRHKTRLFSTFSLHSKEGGTRKQDWVQKNAYHNQYVREMEIYITVSTCGGIKSGASTRSVRRGLVLNEGGMS